ncbi:tRNA (adenosine(37)-N6)-threonylcarbamoyltransferase complex ATPase subunit type 1 TsaE [Candidatus Enterococcus ikei]|uniref:tRNA threonylcarbamoyladenosine biosynthesis protein TsaE n=1 Tax=Candidatus Enterococcus ikei TaxID=2815326 RepID=A0ABS3GVD7_9ENTE|nr:tRNA (adenosine(37)-N6)-threonylcarbamoyltransferase complex ATPase subunit type 1 TsaE [Enterococcus sp. DIV0869a]MBO0439203.1 tRNA (adenosine(37)-N6)-threonylcarbamoyltransferase complex ATPase subunit type 1 TsaE [Enterococcus sp. DIV0869a]
MEILINDPSETEAIAKIIGSVAMPGDTIILSGDLGAGKTTMTKGIALGLGIDQMIKSPTYTIIREYQQGRLPLYHMDVYRIENGADDLGLDEYFEGDGLSVVEWGKLLGEFLPTDYLDIMIAKDPESLEKRIASIQANGSQAEKFLERIQKKMEERA